MDNWERVYQQGERARQRQDRQEPSPPPVPTAENYPVEALGDDFDTDDGEYTVLSPFDHTEPGDATVGAGEFRVSDDSPFFTVAQSNIAPGSSDVAVIVDTNEFIDAEEGEDSIFVGLFKDRSNFLASWYNHTRLDTGFDLHLDGERVEGGIRDGLALDGDSRFAFVLAEETVSGFADVGDGWRHAFTEVVEAIDLTDSDVRDGYRCGFGTLGEGGSIALDRVTVREARQ